jgi:putative membrane protein
MSDKWSRKKMANKMTSKIVKTFDAKDEIILRDYLAMQRTTLANERTLFSYIRTSLYLVLGGIGLLQVEQFENLRWAGYLALGISVFLLIYGIVRYIVLRVKLQKFYDSIGLGKEDLERINNRNE